MVYSIHAIFWFVGFFTFSFWIFILMNAERHKLYFYIDFLLLADAFNEISKGFYPGDPSTHIRQECRPKVITSFGANNLVEVEMDMYYPYLENEWVSKYGWKD